MAESSMAVSAESTLGVHPNWRTYPTALDDFLTLQRIHGVGPRRAERILYACGTVQAFLEEPAEAVARRTAGRLGHRFIAWIQGRARLVWTGSERTSRSFARRGKAQAKWRTSLTAVDDFVAIQRVHGIGPRRAELILSAYGSISAFLADTPEGVAARTRGRIGIDVAERLQNRGRRLDLGANWAHLREVLEVGEEVPEERRSHSTVGDRLAARPPQWLRGMMERLGDRAVSLRHLMTGWSTAPSTNG